MTIGQGRPQRSRRRQASRSGPAGEGAAQAGPGAPGERSGGGQASRGPVGREAAKVAAAAAIEADPVSIGREICLRALTVAPRTEGELVQAMRRKGVPDDASAEVLRRLAGAGLIDDAAFAEAWVASRHGGRGLARRALAGELRRRGVDDDLVQAALSQVDDNDEFVAATALVRRRLAGTAGLPMPTRVRRLSAMLARKGYSGGVAARVVREALGAEAAELLEASDDRLV